MCRQAFYSYSYSYINSQNDVSQDKELNRRIGLAAMTFGKLKSMVCTGWCVSVSQPPAEVCLTDLAWDYPGV